MNWLSIDYLAYSPVTWWIATAIAIRIVTKRMAPQAATRRAEHPNQPWN